MRTSLADVLDPRMASNSKPSGAPADWAKSLRHVRGSDTLDFVFVGIASLDVASFHVWACTFDQSTLCLLTLEARELAGWEAWRLRCLEA